MREPDMESVAFRNTSVNSITFQNSMLNYQNNQCRIRDLENISCFRHWINIDRAICFISFRLQLDRARLFTIHSSPEIVPTQLLRFLQFVRVVHTCKDVLSTWAFYGWLEFEGCRLFAYVVRGVSFVIMC